MKKLLWILPVLGLAVALAPSARTADNRDNSAEEKALQERGKALIAAFNKGDAQALAEFWTPDGDYMDEEGHHFQGRKAIAEEFQKLFAAAKGAELRIHRTAFRFVKPDLAIGDGLMEVIPPDGGPPTASRYTAVHIKQDGQWYFASVREAVATPPSNADKLEDLAWLIGDWEGENEKGPVGKVSFAWDDNKNFIVSSFATTLKDVPVTAGTQWIGWDAADKRIRTWSFDSTGGFGEGTWTRDGDRLVSKTTRTLRDGKKLTSTNILTMVDDNHLTWKSVQRSLDGQALPDTEVVKMKRVKPE
jgi:uncharacterized protein (TIGR02246 family)